MGIALIIVLGIVGLVGAYGIVRYNALVQLKHDVSHAMTNIDVMLRQRNDELAKLVEACRPHLPEAQRLLEQLLQARSRLQAVQNSGDLRALGQAEDSLRATLGRVFAVAEANVELKADPNFRQLQMRISALESSIADRCELYNDSVHRNNSRIEQFPDVLLARRFGFSAAKRLELTMPETADAEHAALFRY